MRIKNIRLKNFRNHKDFDIQFDGDTTLIYGHNGAGKTNILEAIHMLSISKSPRAKYDKDTIHHSSEFTSLESYIEKADEEILLQLIIAKTNDQTNTSSKKVKVNGVPRTQSKFIGNLHTSLFTPEDLRLITGSPTRRRLYINSILIQTDDEYKTQITEYKKIVKRRNKLLETIKKFNTGHSQLSFWNEKLLHYGAAIQNKRQMFLEEINSTIQNHLIVLDPKLTTEVTYAPSTLSAKRLEDLQQYEINSQRTLIGPHRDNFEIKLNQYNAGQFSSRGQKRTLLLALKLSELDYFVKELGTRPILLLDDIFSELDQTHKAAVEDIIGQQQTIITSAEPFNIKGQLITL